MKHTTFMFVVIVCFCFNAFTDSEEARAYFENRLELCKGFVESQSYTELTDALKNSCIMDKDAYPGQRLVFLKNFGGYLKSAKIKDERMWDTWGRIVLEQIDIVEPKGEFAVIILTFKFRLLDSYISSMRERKQKITFQKDLLLLYRKNLDIVEKLAVEYAMRKVNHKVPNFKLPDDFGGIFISGMTPKAIKDPKTRVAYENFLKKRDEANAINNDLGDLEHLKGFRHKMLMMFTQLLYFYEDRDLNELAELIPQLGFKQNEIDLIWRTMQPFVGTENEKLQQRNKLFRALREYRPQNTND